jgi:hypothetical protein
VAGVVAAIAAVTVIAAAMEFAAPLQGAELMPTVIGAALQVAHADTVAAHAAIPAEPVDPAAAHADTAAVLAEATAVEVTRVAIAVAADTRVAIAVAAATRAAIAVAAAMAVAAIGKQLRHLSKRLVCFGRRAFFCGLITLAWDSPTSAGTYWGRTSMPVTVA